MREEVIELLKKIGTNSMPIEAISKKLGYRNNPAKESMLVEIIKELQFDKIVYCTNSRLKMYTLSPYKEGFLSLNKKGFGFVIMSDGEDIYVDEGDLNGAFDRDKVLVKISGEDKTRGRIKEILERSLQIGEVATYKNKRYYLVGEKEIEANIPSRIVDGTLLQLKFPISKKEEIQIIQELGHKNAPGMDIKKILLEYGFVDGFSEEVIEELKYIPTEVSEKDLVGRLDLRNKMIVTIDGDDTKDIDDAVLVEKLDNGNYLFTCAIADVSNYVKEGTALDRESYTKGTSVYMAGKVSPMLPKELSNGICSLNPNVDRLALAFIHEVTPNGVVVSFDVKEAVINSKLKMTYKKVNDILDKNIIDSEYEAHVQMLRDAKEFTDMLYRNRVKSGALEFDIPEPKLIVDDEGKVVEFQKRFQGTGENMIEELMILTNKEASRWVSSFGVNCLYRVHDLPDEEMIKEVTNALKTYGVEIKKVPEISSSFIQYLLEQVKKTDCSDILSSYILRCMAKAKYDVVNIGHFGIGVVAKRGEGYMHTTSPIRREPDTLFHRIIKKLLHGEFNSITSNKDLLVLREKAVYCSKKERDAQDVERETNKMKAAEYFENLIQKGKVEEKYDGRVSGLTPSAMFVALPNLVEGRVSYASMDDFYEFNPEFLMAIGKNNKKEYRLGQSVEVKIVKASKEDRQIDFELVRARKRDDKDGNIKQKGQI